MLEIRVDDPEYLATSHLPAADYGRGQSSLVFSAHHFDARIFGYEILRQLPSAVRAIVVNDDDLVILIERTFEELRELTDHLADILGLVVRRQYDRQLDVGSAISRRGYNQRIVWRNRHRVSNSAICVN